MLSQVAEDFCTHVTTLRVWIRRADAAEGNRAGVTSEQGRELREVSRRIRLLEQENEVLRRAAAVTAVSSKKSWNHSARSSASPKANAPSAIGCRWA